MSDLNTTQHHDDLPAIGVNIDRSVLYPLAGFPRPVPSVGDIGAATDPAVRKAFAAHPVLRTLAEREQRALLTLSRIRTASPQDTICRRYDPSNAAILVLMGYVKLSRTAADGREVFFDIAGPGVCVGDVAVMQRRPHDADLIALSSCRLLFIDARQFRQTFERRESGLLAMLRLTDERLQRVAEQLEDTCTLAASSRLAKALLRLARCSQSPENGDVALRLSQRELAVMTGVCREVVNKQLRAWKAAGWLTLSNGVVTSIRVAPLSLQTGDADWGAEERWALA